MCGNEKRNLKQVQVCNSKRSERSDGSVSDKRREAQTNKSTMPPKTRDKGSRELGDNEQLDDIQRNIEKILSMLISECKVKFR